MRIVPVQEENNSDPWLDTPDNDCRLNIPLQCWK